MKKRLSLAAVISALFLLMSCDSLTDSLNLKELLEQEIKYANTPDITVIVSPEDGTGSTVPVGLYTTKSGYEFSISFTENKKYKFVRWTALKDKEEVLGGVTFASSTSPETTVTVDGIENVRIVPLCVKRIGVSGEPSPKLEQNGVSKDRAITVLFSKSPAESNFIFQESEIPSGSSAIKDEDGKIWAYKEDGFTYFKNITIKDSNGISLAEHFCKPVIEENLLTILTDKTNPITIEAGSLKQIYVTLSGNIKDADGIEMNEDYLWRYQVSSNTDAKASITLAAEKEEGTLSNAGTKSYNMDQTIQLNFTENANYKFLRWDFDSSIVYVPNATLPNTTAVVRNPTLQDTKSIIKAVCAPRMAVTSVLPGPGVNEKDSEIVLTFNNDVSADCEELLENIKISIDGVSVDTNFETRTITGNKIHIENTRFLSVSKNINKVVSVTVPGDFYYEYEQNSEIESEQDPVKISMYKDYTFTYTINNSTVKKAKVDFKVINGKTSLEFSDEFNPGTINQNSHEDLYVDDTIDLSFNLSDGYYFYGWTAKDSKGNYIPEQDLKIENSKAAETKLYTYKELNDVIISALVYKRPTVKSVSPKPENSAEEFAKNTPIQIEFDEPVEWNCVNNIDIQYTGSDFTMANYFNSKHSDDYKTVSFELKKMPVLEKASETFTVKIPHDQIYYFAADNFTKITIGEEDYVWSYKINNKTLTNTTIRFAVDDASASETNDIKVDGISLSSGNKETYNIEQKISVNYTLKPGYSFKGWKLVPALTGFTVNSVSPEDGYETVGTIFVKADDTTYLEMKIDPEDCTKATITVKGSIANGSNNYGITLYACDQLIPAVTSITPEYATTGVSFCTPIKVQFNETVDSSKITFGEKGVVQIVNASDSYTHYENYYSIHSFENNLLVLRPKYETKELLGSSGLTNLKVIVNSTVGEDSEQEQILGEAASHVFRINDTAEKEAPEVSLFILLKYKDPGNENEGKKYTTVIEKESDITEENAMDIYVKNKIGWSIIVNENKENDSDFKQMVIKETLIRDTNGKLVNEKCNDVIYKKNDFSITNSGYKNNNLVYYELKSEKDGLVKLDFIFEDNAGNTTIKTAYVIKDTYINAFEVHPKVVYNSSAERNAYFFDEQNETLSHIYSTKTESIRHVIDGIDTIAYDFSECNDLVYKNGSLSIVHQNNIKLTYGYSEDAINISATQDASNTRIYYVERDASRLTYIKIRASDGAGNTTSVIRAIPPALDIDTLTDGNGFGPLIVSKKLQDCALFYKNYEALDAGVQVFYRLISLNKESDLYKTTYATEISGFEDFANEAKQDGKYLATDELYFGFDMFAINPEPDSNVYDQGYYKYLPSGTYEIFILPYFEFYEGIYYSALSNPYKVIVKYNSETNLNEYELIPKKSDSDMEEGLPSSINVTATSSGVNTCKHTIKVTYPDNFVKGPYTYKIAYTPIQPDNYGIYDGGVRSIFEKIYIPYATYYSDTEEFEVLSGFKYDVQVSCISNDCEVRTSFKNTVADCLYDNVPPKSDVITSALSNNYMSNHSLLYKNGGFNSYPYDYSGLYVNSDGNNEVEYWVIKNPDNVKEAVKYTENQLYSTYSSNKQVLYFKYVKQSELELPLGELQEEGYYTIAYKIKDANGNYLLKFYPVINTLLNTNIHPDIAKDNDSGIWYWNIPSTKSIVYTHASIETYSVAGKSRIRNGNDPHFYLNRGRNKFEITDEYANKFVKFQARNDSGFSNLYYCYPSYIISKSESESEFQCNVYNMIAGYGNNFQVFTDNPILIHTMYWHEDLGSDYAYWETKGIEAGLQVSTSTTSRNFTYEVTDEMVPEGNYFIVVAHFANGKVITSEVRKK